MADITLDDQDNFSFGTEDRDEIFALGGDDVVFALGKRDFVNAGEGDDEVHGGSGVVFFEGFGGLILGDEIDGEGGDDRLFGDSGNDNLSGGAGDDHLVGGGGDDELLGGDDNEGNDKLEGGGGSDSLDGGGGNNFLVGGADADTFNFAFNVSFTDFDVPGSPSFPKIQGDDTIEDFELGLDTIRMEGLLSVLDSDNNGRLDDADRRVDADNQGQDSLEIDFTNARLTTGEVGQGSLTVLGVDHLMVGTDILLV